MPFWGLFESRFYGLPVNVVVQDLKSRFYRPKVKRNIVRIATYLNFPRFSDHVLKHTRIYFGLIRHQPGPRSTSVPDCLHHRVSRYLSCLWSFLSTQVFLLHVSLGISLHVGLARLGLGLDLIVLVFYM